MTYITEVLRKSNFAASTINKLENYQSRQGFELVDQANFEQMTKHFTNYLAPLHIIPLMADNANYLCVYVDGFLKGKVCEWNHEECYLPPMFRAIDNLLAAIESNPECTDWIHLPKDYPQLDDETFTIEDKKSLLLLHDIYNEVKDIEEDFDNEKSEKNKKYILRQQVAFCIFDMTPPKKITELIPFLDDTDMFVQEAAIQTFGRHQYQPIKFKLQELLTTAKHNGRIAAEGVLQRMNENK